MLHPWQAILSLSPSSTILSFTNTIDASPGSTKTVVCGYAYSREYTPSDRLIAPVRLYSATAGCPSAARITATGPLLLSDGSANMGGFSRPTSSRLDTRTVVS